MARQGFKVEVESPKGTVFTRKSLDKDQGEGKYVQNKIPFKFEFDETMRPNFGRVTVTNINDKQRQEFKKNKEMKMRAGWLPEKDNSEFVSKVDIINTNVYVRDNGTTYDTDVMFRDTPMGYHRVTVSDNWSKGTTACQILKDILKNKINAKQGQFKCESKKKYRRGKSFYCSAYNALQQVSSDAEVKLFFYNKKYYVIDASKSLPTTTTIKQNDVIKGPFTKSGINKESILQFDPKIKPGHDIQVKSSNGKFRVYSGKHTSKDGTRLYSEVKLV